MNDNDIKQQINTFFDQYLKMDINGVIINCPYWINKIFAGKVVLRGFLNGKGEAANIRSELIHRYNSILPNSRFRLNPENLRKFAKRERIGIDCSGFVYRVLNKLICLKYLKTKFFSLNEIFSGGINKTNVKALTSLDFCFRVEKIADFRLGDMIRLWEGKHLAVIEKVEKNKIIYIHSSSLSTKIQGVHKSIINIININKPLEDQSWEEKTKKGENFGKKYFRSEKGDGVFRLKVFS